MQGRVEKRKNKRERETEKKVIKAENREKHKMKR